MPPNLPSERDFLYFFILTLLRVEILHPAHSYRCQHLQKIVLKGFSHEKWNRHTNSRVSCMKARGPLLLWIDPIMDFCAFSWLRNRSHRWYTSNFMKFAFKRKSATKLFEYHGSSVEALALDQLHTIKHWIYRSMKSILQLYSSFFSFHFLPDLSGTRKHQ